MDPPSPLKKTKQKNTQTCEDFPPESVAEALMEKQPRSLATAKQPATLCTSEKALGSILYYSNRTGLGGGEEE